MPDLSKKLKVELSTGWLRSLCNLGLQEAINNTWTQPTDGSSFTSANWHHNASRGETPPQRQENTPECQTGFW
ncbi:MAG: hypothetical protein V4719_29195 [Planctomycetota bacterium]